MHKALRVARTEYLNSIRSKAFIIGVIMLPIMVVCSLGIQALARKRVDITDRRFAVLDQTGRFYSVIAAKAKERNEREIFELSSGGKGGQIRPAFRPEEVRPSAGEERPDLALSERVRKKEIFAFITISRTNAPAESSEVSEIAYQTETPTDVELPTWLEGVINEELKRLRFESANLYRALVTRLTRQVPLKKLGLVKRGEGGQVVDAKMENRLATFGIPFISMFLLFMMVMSSAPTLLNTVLEEKMQKIAEVLISSVSPFDLMLGKLLGAVLLSLTLSLIYLVAAGFAVWKYGVSDLIPASHYFWFLIFQLLALLIYGSIFSAVGAACTEIRDAQNMMVPAMLGMLVPMWVFLPILQSPNSAFSRLMSLIPPFTPMLMMLRISVPPGPPGWEIALGVGLTILFMLGCVWASAKIFRIGLLSQGQAPTFARLISWVFSR
jgi:ABC-2 type transport system permease protein